ncbi:MAG: hypothetical protein WAV40_04600 [Microgenomates group bacterium]
MNQLANESEVYALMIKSMMDTGALGFRVNGKEKMALLGHKGINSAKSKDLDCRDGVDNLMLLSYYRALRLNRPDGGTEWHGGREGAVISRLLHQPEPIMYAMATFLLNTAVV